MRAPPLVYRYVGDVLIALNPYMDLPNLTSSRTLVGCGRRYRPSVDPHTHAIAQVEGQECGWFSCRWFSW